MPSGRGTLVVMARGVSKFYKAEKGWGRDHVA
jgi:hypothetical protein